VHGDLRSSERLMFGSRSVATLKTESKFGRRGTLLGNLILQGKGTGVDLNRQTVQ
jgi:hypothetical protein